MKPAPLFCLAIGVTFLPRELPPHQYICS